MRPGPGVLAFRRDNAVALAAVARGSQPVTGLVLARLAVG